MKSAGVILDFDGVLADTTRQALTILGEIAASKGVPMPSTEFLRTHSTQEVLRALRVRWYEVPWLVAWARRRLAKERGSIALTAEATSLVTSARAAGAAVFVVSSNAGETIQGVLERGGLFGELTKVIPGVGIFRKRRVLRRLLRRERLDSRRTCYVGDETRDMEAARACGVVPVAVAWGYQHGERLRQAGAAYVLERGEEIVGVIGEMGESGRGGSSGVLRGREA